jgi:hypothetical protein
MKRIFLLILTVAACGMAQSGGALVGLITGASGEAVRNARVVLVDTHAGTRRETTTNDLGIYAFSLLPAGEYRLEAVKAGLTPLELGKIQLREDEKRSLRLQWAIK